MRLVRRYPDALQLVKLLSDEAALGASAARRGVLGITHRKNVLLLHSENQDAELSIKSAAAHRNDDTKEKRTAAVSRPCSFSFIPTPLLDELVALH